MRIRDWRSDVCSSDLETNKAARGLLFCGTAVLDQLFLDAGGLAGQRAEVVQLGLAHVTATLDADAVDHRAIALESTLDAYTIGDLANGESTVQTRSDEHTSELQSLMSTSYAVLSLKKKTV